MTAVANRRRIMPTSFASATVLVTLLFLAGSAAVSSAADMSDREDFTKLVLKAFSLPSKGTCKEYRGFQRVGSSQVSWVNGAVCASSDNDHVSFLYMVSTTQYLTSEQFAVPARR
jgi:hypothetical protein